MGALLGLVLPVVALLIRMESRGPIFYACKRVGKGGRLFSMYKFRTMYETTCPVGQSISPKETPRVTDMGRWLRRTKLNEFPPDLPVAAGRYRLNRAAARGPGSGGGLPTEAKAVFAVKPGLIGPNQISGRNEEEWFPQEANPRQYYLDVILPDKVAKDLRVSPE